MNCYQLMKGELMHKYFISFSYYYGTHLYNGNKIIELNRIITNQNDIDEIEKEHCSSCWRDFALLSFIQLEQ